VPRRALSLILGAAGLCGILAVGASAACSSNPVSKTVANGSVAPVPRSTGGTSGGPNPTVPGPASKYAPSLKDLPGIFNVNVPETFTQNISTFASSYLFTSAQQGQDLSTQWKIIDGFKVSYDPEGLAAGVVKGEYFAVAEVYLFQDNAGASDAYTYIAGVFAKGAGAEPQDAKQLGNSSAGYRIVQGTVGASDVAQVFHSFVFRRGNIVAVVRTQGAEPRMTIDRARDIAVIIDDRILGNREATAPTPIPTPKINLPPTAEPTQ
jgi:hypothetical protein